MKHTARDECEAGFTLIELLIVMIIIGILASIAIPVFLSQRAKARDAATQSDVSRLGKELAAYFVDGTGTVSISFVDATPTSPATVTVTDDAGYTGTALPLSRGTEVPASGASSNLGNSTSWCVALTNPQGGRGAYRFSANRGLQQGTC